jgi:hypothetical protein
VIAVGLSARFTPWRCGVAQPCITPWPATAPRSRQSGVSNLVFAAAVTVWLVNTLASLLRGSGEMLFPATLVVGGSWVHLILVRLIFGLGPVTPFGSPGWRLARAAGGPRSCD